MEEVYAAIYLGSSDCLKAIDNAVNKLLKTKTNFDGALKDKFGVTHFTYFSEILNSNSSQKDDNRVQTPEKRIKLSNSIFGKKRSVRIRTRSCSTSEADADEEVNRPSERKRKRRLPETETDPSEVDSDREVEKKHKEKLAKRMRRTYPAENYLPVRTPQPSPVTPSPMFFARPSALEQTPSSAGCEPTMKDVFYLVQSIQKTVEGFHHSFRIMNDRQSAMDARLIALQANVASLDQKLSGHRVPATRAPELVRSAPTREEKGKMAYKPSLADDRIMMELRNDGRLEAHEIKKHTDFLRVAMCYRFDEGSFKDTVLYCPNAKGYGHVPGTKEFPGRFTDSLIVVCAEKFGMAVGVVRASLKDLIRRKKKALEGNGQDNTREPMSPM